MSKLDNGNFRSGGEFLSSCLCIGVPSSTGTDSFVFMKLSLAVLKLMSASCIIVKFTVLNSTLWKYFQLVNKTTHFYSELRKNTSV